MDRYCKTILSFFLWDKTNTIIDPGKRKNVYYQANIYRTRKATKGANWSTDGDLTLFCIIPQNRCWPIYWHSWDLYRQWFLMLWLLLYQMNKQIQSCHNQIWKTCYKDELRAAKGSSFTYRVFWKAFLGERGQRAAHAFSERQKRKFSNDLINPFIYIVLCINMLSKEKLVYKH